MLAAQPPWALPSDLRHPHVVEYPLAEACFGVHGVDDTSGVCVALLILVVFEFSLDAVSGERLVA